MTTPTITDLNPQKNLIANSNQENTPKRSDSLKSKTLTKEEILKVRINNKKKNLMLKINPEKAPKNINILTELFEKQNALIKELRIKIFDSSDSAPTNAVSLADILNNWNLIIFFDPMAKHNLSIEEEEKEIDQQSIFYLRGEKLALKYLTLNLYHSTSISPSLAVTKQMLNINSLLKKRDLKILSSTPEEKAYTRQIITKRIKDIKRKLKELMVPIISSYFVQGAWEKEVLETPIKHPKISRYLNSIAPYGLKGFEEDYYYINRLLIDMKIYGKRLQMFSEEQANQIRVYFDEIEAILFLITLPPTHEDINAEDLISNRKSFPLRYGDFMKIESPISNNLFSKLIAIFERYLISLYNAALREHVSVKNALKNTDNN